MPPLKTQKATGLPSAGWWNYGGILREVYLRRVNKVDMQEFLARPKLPCRACAATLLLRATLRNVTSRRQRVSVRASVGALQAHFPSIVLAPHATGAVRSSGKLGTPAV